MVDLTITTPGGETMTGRQVGIEIFVRYFLRIMEQTAQDHQRMVLSVIEDGRIVIKTIRLDGACCFETTITCLNGSVHGFFLDMISLEGTSRLFVWNNNDGRIHAVNKLSIGSFGGSVVVPRTMGPTN